MAAPEIIRKLVEKFHAHHEVYKSQNYNETQVRREFIDPMFKALGWDIDNEQGYAEQYKDVVHEDAIKIGGVTKAPDYSFRIGGVRKFFLEAKKPAVNLKDDISPAFQLRRYAWTAKLPLSLLTDFEEFIVYDTRIKPDKKDKASTGRTLYMKYTDYIDRWDEIADLFAREAILKGAFDKYADSTKKKRGTAEVDDAFLAEIEEWRLLLARNIALRNPDFTQRELNFAVQRTIDRIVFLRICEDRGIEQYGRLQALFNGDDVYDRMRVLFERADERYNSGLFHFAKEKERPGVPDTLTPRMTIDDKVLKDILKRLYYPESPYEFAVLPAETLGQIYEQFLGSVIRLTGGHQAKVDQKPEVRKAGGVYYTPTYIVDYIVKHTVGKLLEDKSPQAAAKIRVLDPACGSGSFLLGAYQFLLDWHLEQYIQNTDKWSKGKNPRIYEHHVLGWRLTTSERKRILLDNIYGVDIDNQAVEVTKLSLLLKVLEEENAETLQRQLSLFHERALPDLADNIKCGNSLIGPDFYQGKQLDAFDEDELYRINAFDWNTEFKTIMNDGGFHAVIGNPPYVRQEGLGDYKEYFGRHYVTAAGTADLYVYFMEKGVALLREDGLFSYIVANKWMRANYGKPLRVWLAECAVEEVVDFGDLPVFEQATTYPCIIRIAKKGDIRSLNAVNVPSLDFTDLEEHVAPLRFKIQKKRLGLDGWTLVREEVHDLLAKIRSKGVPLGEYVGGKIYRGVLTGLNKAFVIDPQTKERLIKEDPKSTELIKPFLMGRDIKRYQHPQAERYLIFTRRGVDIEQYPAIKAHLLQFKRELEPKPKGFKGTWPGRKPGPYKWYEIQDAVAYYEEFEQPKIIVPAIVRSATYYFDESAFYSNDKTTIIASDEYYLIGVLNSKVPDFVLHSLASTKQGGYFEYKPMYIEQLPISPDSASPEGEAISARASHMIDLQRRLTTANTPQERTLLERQIAAIDAKIDRLVYDLYGLTEDEIAIVEAEMNK